MAKYDFIDERSLIETHLLATWDTTNYPIYFQYTTLKPDNNSEVYLRFSIPQSTTLNDSFQGDGKGTMTVGTILVQVYTKKNTPTHTVRKVLNALDSTFSNLILDNARFYFKTSKVVYGQTDELKSGYNVANWSISFTRK